MGGTTIFFLPNLGGAPNNGNYFSALSQISYGGHGCHIGGHVRVPVPPSRSYAIEQMNITGKAANRCGR